MGSNGKMDAFLIGALVGGAAMFLLGTKKGNKVLKVLTEEGHSALNDLISDFEAKNNGVKPTPKSPEKPKQEATLDEEEKITLESPVQNGTSHANGKRFFKRVSGK